ncbi:hypothetical protein FRB91_008797 [Serendipita sp. 411]|nr:hypothetical protein FRB91_008797 [Serendipita sp. 411]
MSVADLEAKAESVAGTATKEEKGTMLLWLHVLGEAFAGELLQRLIPLRYDTEHRLEGVPRERGTLICEMKVEEDMANGYNNMHGGCSAYLVDVCTSVCLTAFSPSHVSLSLQLEYHQPIPVGTTIEIVSTTRALGRRVLSAGCEIIHKEKRTLLVSGSHVKMPPSQLPSKL